MRFYFHLQLLDFPLRALQWNPAPAPTLNIVEYDMTARQILVPIGDVSCTNPFEQIIQSFIFISGWTFSNPINFVDVDHFREFAYDCMEAQLLRKGSAFAGCGIAASRRGILAIKHFAGFFIFE